ncbi:PREDICTED: probable polyamine transporter At1g31830 isoform X1 [Lupinus angustifolius]|uniref:probable polyamine transporter At1g31830 isoform X1 n=1 Tax=Lupinus angustifolius TaxID=3871 RepID=UPI00092F8F69|nr:PREDICTED: probable polyamine transporter At1g31830 isoform X1 [Lupinus angustifolius]
MKLMDESIREVKDKAESTEQVAVGDAIIAVLPPSPCHSCSHAQTQERSRTTTNRQDSIAMGEFNGDGYVTVGEIPSPRANHMKKVSLLPLVFLIFYEVSGGPFGIEDTVNAAGPLLALLGFLVFPLIWSIPEALITAEMGTMFPENSGYVVWVSSALGPYWGFQQGWMKWLSGVIDNALYPVLFLDYLKSGIPALGGGLPRVIATWGLTIVLTYMNYRGLTIVGFFAVFLGVFSLIPFVVMGFLAIPDLKPKRWSVINLNDVDWSLYLNTLFWNLNYWDSISTLAGEVDNPKKTLPKALFYALILVVLAYFFPLLIGTGVVPLKRELWTDGYLSDIAMIVGGVWLRWWLQGAAAMSNMGMFVAEMSSDSFMLLGMAERGMLPEFFMKRSRHGTPLIGILFSAFGVILLSWLSFQEIVAAENFLYCFGMILEFIAFILMRIKHPNLSRPYKIPGGTAGAIVMCIPPTILICIVLALSSLKVMVISLIAVAIGLVLQPCLKYVEKKRWMKFSHSSELPAFENEESTHSLVD